MRIMQLSGAKSSILNTGLGTKNKHGLICYLLNTGLGLQLTAYTGSDVLTKKRIVVTSAIIWNDSPIN